MKIYSKGKNKPSEQLFNPLVDPDWEYFKNGTFHIISSSHQDIAWMDTPDVCRHERVHDIIAPALDVMKTDKKYAFGMEQTLNLKEFLEEFPERKNEVLQRCEEGRFTWGATNNQPYEGMQTGEQLIRELYFGKRWLEKTVNGCEVKTAFNTDVPGRTLQFPQILAKSGVENLFVSRMEEGFYDWYSPDGSSIATYSSGNYGWAVIFYKFFEQDAIEAMHKLQSRVKMWSDYYQKRNLPPHFAIVISNDASGPADYGKIVSEWNDIIDKTGARVPSLRHSTVTSFMDEIKKPNAEFDKIHGDRPNLWAYIHGPGHHKAVTASRKAGRMLPSAEIFNTIDAMLQGSFSNYPGKELSHAFEESIYPDHGWGGKNGAITDSIFRSKLEFAAKTSDTLMNVALTSISERVKTERPNAVVVYNDLSWERNGIATVELDDKGDYYVVDANGETVPSQMASEVDKKVVEFSVTEIPSLGYATYYLRKGKKIRKVNKEVTANSVTNDFYTLRLGDGGITYLKDITLGKEIIRSTRFSGGDVLTLGYDGNGAGEFTEMTEPNMEGYDKTSSHSSDWTMVEDGEVFTTFKNTTDFEHAQIVQQVKVYHQQKKIDFDLDLLNWDGTHNREFRFALPLNMDDSKITYEVPFAIAEVGKTEMKQAPRGWAWGGTYDQKPVEIHPREVMNYISSDDDSYAVTLATDVALADWIDPTREAVDYPVLQGLLMASHKSCHAEGNWYDQKGDHHFEFSITSHLPSDKMAYHFGNSSNHSFKTILKKQVDKNAQLPPKMSFFKVSDPMVRISTIKKSEDDDTIILRLAEMEGVEKHPEIELTAPLKEVIKTNMIEREEKSLGRQEGKSFKVPIGKNAIETFKLVLSQS